MLAHTHTHMCLHVNTQNPAPHMLAHNTQAYMHTDAHIHMHTHTHMHMHTHTQREGVGILERRNHWEPFHKLPSTGVRR